jgi:hypothetical protein
MRYMLMHKLDESSPTAYNPSPEFMARMGEFIGDVMKTGILLAADGLGPSAQGKRITVRGGKKDVVDGPFTESKEVVGGYAIVQVHSLEEAVELGSRFADLFDEDIAVEIRPISDADSIAQRGLG